MMSSRAVLPLEWVAPGDVGKGCGDQEGKQAVSGKGLLPRNLRHWRGNPRGGRRSESDQTGEGMPPWTIVHW